MKKRCILFDMDGVLIDSRPSMEIGWIEVCNQFNFSIPFARYLEYVGMPFEHTE